MIKNHQIKLNDYLIKSVYQDSSSFKKGVIEDKRIPNLFFNYEISINEDLMIISYTIIELGKKSSDVYFCVTSTSSDRNINEQMIEDFECFKNCYKNGGKTRLKNKSKEFQKLFKIF